MQRSTAGSLHGLLQSRRSFLTTRILYSSMWFCKKNYLLLLEEIKIDVNSTMGRLGRTDEHTIRGAVFVVVPYRFVKK